MSFWNSKRIKKTKKQHRCEFCGVKIQIGSSCHNEVGVYYRDFNNYYLCDRCHVLLHSRNSTWVDTFDYELGEFQECLYNSSHLDCPKCGKSNFREVEFSDNMLSCTVKCDYCNAKYTVGLSGDALLSIATPYWLQIKERLEL